ncbi:uncharacterized protein BT62DRAFT_999519 [Guyanagaster necrorhizus]|uniref:Uncharacterized protein n=1 Tax=Guyanagaster necrorhizus TaxID=856835 RepID=A0A9P8AXP4_9AGAR|nr:uncharacterized protein BT62DRAFT_999519 [Guyanagaster necrorhizus MCA 3950]KAG7451818.1 hypothetical protein BT62DRAFT_999519 [Guyanagaster necrorhizus MCA 3950]
MPSEKEWLTFAKWGEIYGITLTAISMALSALTHCFLRRITICFVLDRRIVVVNSIQMAIDMFDNKSSIYSGRPIMEMAGELMGLRDSLACLSYGTRFRNQRRLAHHNLVILR